MFKNYTKITDKNAGFALPTVLIVSIIMLTTLMTAISASSVISVSLNDQYYSRLARNAGEAGLTYARACLSKNSGIHTWAVTKPLTPQTDCFGNIIGTMLDGCRDESSACYAVLIPTTDSKIRSTFSVGAPTVLSDSGEAIRIMATGKVELLTSSGAVWHTYEQYTVISVK